MTPAAQYIKNLKTHFLNSIFVCSPFCAEVISSTLESMFSNYFLQTYYSLVLYLLLSALICGILASLAYLFSLSAVQDNEKKSEYECGFEPFDSATRLPFDVHFYLVGILFLIFDVEIALLFPWVLSLNNRTWFGFYLRVGFILILAVGFLYEWKRGALIWPSRQRESVYKVENGYMLGLINLFNFIFAAYKVVPIPSAASSERTNPTSLYYPLVCTYNYNPKNSGQKKNKFENFRDWEIQATPEQLKRSRDRKKANQPSPVLPKQTKRSEYYLRFYIRAHKFAIFCKKAIKKIFKKLWIAPVVASNSEIFAAYTNEDSNLDVFSYFYQIVTFLSPELVSIFCVIFALTALSLDLGRDCDKKSLTQLTFEALCNNRLGLAVRYVIQFFTIQPHSLFNGYIMTTQYTSARKLLTFFAAGFVLINSKKYMEKSKNHLRDYTTILSLTVVFRRLLIMSANFRAAFRVIVGFSLNLYVLILFGGAFGACREAGVKYYFLSTFSSGLIIYGVFLVLVLLGSLHFLENGQKLHDYLTLVENNSYLLAIRLGLILNGIFFKLSAFPGHLWAAEVYEGSPDPIRAFFRLPTKIAVLSFLFATLRTARLPISFLWQPVIRVAACGSLVWGALGALSEKRTKRFLAYASINQIGFLLLGLTSVSFSGCQSSLIYLLIYRRRNFGFLTIFLNARRERERSLVYLTDFRSLGQQNWLLSWSSARRLFSRAGIPPLAGFFGKYFLLLHVQQQKLYAIVLIPLACSLPSAYYYLRIIKTFWFEGSIKLTVATCALTLVQQTVIFIAEGFLFAFPLFSGPALRIAEPVSQSLFAPSF